MGEARNVVERFYQRFGAGDMTEAFACFAASASP
jgi:ketosteroid isomerase-like protein